MSYTPKNVQENQAPDSSSRPQQRKPRGLAMLFFLLGGLVIAGGLALLFWQIYQQHPATGSTGASTPTLTSTTQAQKTGQGDPPVYYQTVEENVAQGLHLSVEQIKAKLQAGGRGTSLSLLAAQQGISLTQLRTILLDAEQKGHDVLIRLGDLTQQQSEQGMQALRSWDLTTLDQHISNYFRSK